MDFSLGINAAAVNVKPALECLCRGPASVASKFYAIRVLPGHKFVPRKAYYPHAVSVGAFEPPVNRCVEQAVSGKHGFTLHLNQRLADSV
jgi:hypothetical protein